MSGKKQKFCVIHLSTSRNAVLNQLHILIHLLRIDFMGNPTEPSEKMISHLYLYPKVSHKINSAVCERRIVHSGGNGI